MYRIVMSTGDWAEAETIAACLTAAATMAEDSGWGNVEVSEATYNGTPTPSLAWTLNMHLIEVAP